MYRHHRIGPPCPEITIWQVDIFAVERNTLEKNSRIFVSKMLYHNTIHITRGITEPVYMMAESQNAISSKDPGQIKGQSPNFNQVFEEYQRPIYNYLLRMTQNTA